MPDPDSIVRPITSTLRFLVAATIVLYIALGGLAIKTYSDATSNKEALCAVRAYLERRIQGSKDFLAENPEGIPGIQPQVLRDSIKNQQSTVDALGDLSC